MGTIGLVLIIAGVVIMLVYAIFILINAFKKSILWGLGSLFIPFVGLIYVIMHWELNKKPFLRYLIGLAVYIVGAVLAGMGAGDAMEAIESGGVPLPNAP